MEPLITYDEQRFDGKRTFQLFADRVFIRGTETFASAYEQTFLLESLRPEPDRIWYRSPSFMSGLKLAGGSFIALSVLRSGFGMSVVSHVGSLAVGAFITGLLTAFATRQRVEYAVFQTLAGAEVLSVARAGKQVADYDAFIQRLIQQIQSCGTKGVDFPD